jgi:hypothetical protein
MQWNWQSTFDDGTREQKECNQRDELHGLVILSKKKRFEM